MLPPIEKSIHKPKLVENGKLKDAAGVRLKVEQDIAFLTDRISLMQQHPRPNLQLIEHYESMLKSRRSVLAWLLDGCEESAPAPQSHTKR